MIKNINKPTDPFWAKVSASCATIGAIVIGTATVMHIEWLQITAVIATCIGSVLPLWMPVKDK